MAWPYYQFVDLDDAAKQARREALNRHGKVAHASVLALLAVVLAYRGAALLVRRYLGGGSDYDAVPGSPAAKRRRLGRLPGVSAAARRAAWWLAGDVVVLGICCGRRDQLLFGSLWTLWLLFLCVHDTGNGKSGFLY